MELLGNFLINLILFFKRPDYKIVERSIEYWVDHEKDFVTHDDFWERESEGWDRHTDTYYRKLEGDQTVPPPPEVVTKVLVRVKFWYNNRIYKYLSYDHDHSWPPVVERGVHFNIPLTSAQLLDEEGAPVKDVLAKIRRYAGPSGDFYGDEKIDIADMLYYEQGLYPKILLKNIFGLSKTVSTSDGYISDLRIP